MTVLAGEEPISPTKTGAAPLRQWACRWRVPNKSPTCGRGSCSRLASCMGNLLEKSEWGRFWRKFWLKAAFLCRCKNLEKRGGLEETDISRHLSYDMSQRQNDDPIQSDSIKLTWLNTLLSIKFPVPQSFQHRSGQRCLPHSRVWATAIGTNWSSSFVEIMSVTFLLATSPLSKRSWRRWRWLPASLRNGGEVENFRGNFFCKKIPRKFP